jgi:hypothetical protein
MRVVDNTSLFVPVTFVIESAAELLELEAALRQYTPTDNSRTAINADLFVIVNDVVSNRGLESFSQ